MGDGWQTRRSRVEGHADFVVLRLGARGHILQAEVDTSHFKGNFPREIKLEGCFTESNIPEEDAKWFTLIEPTPTGPHGLFHFNTAHTDKVFTHAKISIIPGKAFKFIFFKKKEKKYLLFFLDGGFKRLRLFGVREGGKLPSLPIVAPSTPKNLVTAEPLTAEAYKAFGHVIQSGHSDNFTSANQGTAEKYHQVAQVTNTFPQNNGKVHMCVFHCRPTNELPFTIKLLERHPYSSQAFIPMTDNKTRGYLVAVALNGKDDKPDMSTLKTFVASSTQGISYNAGVWHHPMVALEYPTDFAVVVHESGVPQDDCNEVEVPHVVVQVPGYHIF